MDPSLEQLGAGHLWPDLWGPCTRHGGRRAWRSSCGQRTELTHSPKGDRGRVLKPAGPTAATAGTATCHPSKSRQGLTGKFKKKLHLLYLCPVLAAAARSAFWNDFPDLRFSTTDTSAGIGSKRGEIPRTARRDPREAPPPSRPSKRRRRWVIAGIPGEARDSRMAHSGSPNGGRKREPESQIHRKDGN